MKKGFTLIELLAVIIILAVIALIATPIVLDVVDTAKLKAFEESAYGIIETVKLKNYDDMFEGNSNNKIYTFPTDELVFQGERPKGGSVASLKGEIILAIHNGKWCATKKFGDDKVAITENIVDCNINYYQLSGKITETADQGKNKIFDIRLLKDDKIIYETKSDEEGNYYFTDIVNDNYLLLISKPKKTKYGRKIYVNDNIVNNLSVSLYSGDVDADGRINQVDGSIITACYGADFIAKPICEQADLNDDGRVNQVDRSIYLANVSKHDDIDYNE